MQTYIWVAKYFSNGQGKRYFKKNRYPLFYIIYPGLSPAAPSDMAPSPQKPHPERIAPLRENAVTPVEKTHRGAPIKRSKWHLGNEEYIILFRCTQFVGGMGDLISHENFSWPKKSPLNLSPHSAIYIIKQDIRIYVAYSRLNGWTDWAEFFCGHSWGVIG